jgi:YHS domain-containing protein
MKYLSIAFLALFAIVASCAYAQAPAAPAKNAPAATEVKAAPVVPATPEVKPATATVVDVKNTLCPVSGAKVSGNDFVEYKGKRYALCCPACKAQFLKDPDKFIKKMEKQEAEKK